MPLIKCIVALTGQHGGEQDMKKAGRKLMLKSRKYWSLYIVVLMLPLCSCAQELTSQTPTFAASNAIRFAENGSLSQFKGMFESQAEANATNELLQSLSQSSTSSAAHETCHFVMMENGDVWLFRFAPTQENKVWEITSIEKLSTGEAATIKMLFGN